LAFFPFFPLFSAQLDTFPFFREVSVVQLGLRANWQQFTLLVIVNAFVGAMVGSNAASCRCSATRCLA